MRYIAEIVTKSYEKDAKGNILNNTYLLSRKIRINEILPYSSANASKEYGFEGKTSHKSSTYDKAEANEMLRFNDKLYRIVEVSSYPRITVLILELVK